MTSTNPNVEEATGFRNFIFLGSTGVGKSSSCNTLYQTNLEPSGPFVVGNSEFSCTTEIDKKTSKLKQINIIDTPGFENNKLSEEKINEIIVKNVVSIFREEDEDNEDKKKVEEDNSTKQVDGFILVTKMIPRAQTLRMDIERVSELFGPRVFRSLIVLVIYPNKGDDKNNFLEKLGKMEETIKIIEEGKGEKINEDCFCVWDNLDPREEQEKELLEKLWKLKPYTHQDYAESKAYLSEKNKMQSKKENHEESMTEIISTIEELDEKIRGPVLNNSKDKIREQALEKILRVIELKNQAYSKELDESLIKNNEMIEKAMIRIEELERGAKNMEEKRHIGDLFSALICRRRKLNEMEKDELKEVTINKGIKEAVKEGALQFSAKGSEQLAIGSKNLAKEGAKTIVKEGTKKILKIAAKEFVKQGASHVKRKILCNLF